MNDLICPYCGVECATFQALEGHKRLCPDNPANAQNPPAVEINATETTKHTAALGNLDVEPVAKRGKATPSPRHT